MSGLTSDKIQNEICIYLYSPSVGMEREKEELKEKYIPTIETVCRFK